MSRTFRSTRHRLVVLVAAAATISVGALQAPAQADLLSVAAAPTTFAFQGKATGSLLTVGSTLKSGPTALATRGCTTQPGVSENDTETTKLGSGLNVIGTTGTTVDTVTSTIETGRYINVSESDIQNVKLLGGMITADAIHSTATAKSLPSEATGEATFVNLVIGGQPIGGSPPPNTTIPLDALGYVVLNEQTTKATPRFVKSSVNALHLHLFPTAVQATTDLVLGQAISRLSAAQFGVMNGFAYGTNAGIADGVVGSGRTSFIPLPCLGTKDQPRTATVAGVDVPGAVSTGTNTSTVKGNITDLGTTASAVNDIQDVNLFGQITADAVHTALDGSRTATGATYTNGSNFVNLVIQGETYGGTAPENTKIDVPGLGTLWLNRKITLASGKVEIRSIQLILTQGAGGLPPGADIRIGVVALNLRG